MNIIKWIVMNTGLLEMLAVSILVAAGVFGGVLI